jgi:acyl-homoserine lactone acylase PvdQ
MTGVPGQGGGETQPQGNQAQNQPATPLWVDGTPYDPARAKQFVDSLRSTETAIKKERDELAAKVAEFEGKDKSQLDQLTTKATTLEQQLREATEKLANTNLQLKVTQLCGDKDVAIGDPEAALLFVQARADKIQRDATSGEPTNLKELLVALKAEKPYLAANGSVSAGDPANPSRNNRGGMSMDAIKNMTTDQILANWDQVQTTLNGQK